MEDEILAAIKRSVPAFVEIAMGERPDADEHSLTVAATMSLLFCTIHVINLSGQTDATKTLIDNIVDRIPETLSPGTVNMNVATLDEEVLARLAKIPNVGNYVDNRTAVNFIYTARVSRDVKELYSMREGPMGPLSGAAIVIGETLLGKGNTSGFALINMVVMEFNNNLISALQGVPVRPAYSPDVPVPHSNPAQTSENAHYEQALDELESGTKDRGTWAKAFAESADDDSAQRLYIKLRVEQLSQADKKAQPPTANSKTAVHSSTPARQNTTPTSALSDASDMLGVHDVSAKPADENKPRKKGFLYRIAQGISLAVPLHFLSGWFFHYHYGLRGSFNAWDHITGQLWMSYLAFPFALGYLYYRSNIYEDESENAPLVFIIATLMILSVFFLR
jgi:hypothetical protein